MWHFNKPLRIYYLFTVFLSFISNDSNKKNKKKIIGHFQAVYSFLRCYVFVQSFITKQANDVITKTRLYKFDPLKPHFSIEKPGFTGVYISFLISAQKHTL